MANKALIVVDIQNDLAHPDGALFHPGNDKIQPVIESLISEFKQNNNLIIGVKIELTPGVFEQAKLKFGFKKPCFIKDDWGSEYCIDPNLFDLMITKNEQLLKSETSAFWPKANNKSILNEFLQTNKVTEVTVCGIATSIGVSSTAADAFRQGYKVNINLDACSGPANEIILV